MKRIVSEKRFRNLAIMVLMLLAGSCLDYNVTTRVNRDGSIFRQYRIRGDSAKIFDGSLMIPSGSEWKISHSWGPKNEKDTLSGEKQYVYKASRTFGSIDELRDWLETDTSIGTIKPIVSLKKKFRWFYTYYEYSEVYPMTFPFQKIPVDSFLTDMEQSVIMDDDRTAYSSKDGKLIWKGKDTIYNYTSADSVEINKISELCQQKLGRWIIASIMEDYLEVLNKHFKNDAAVRAISLKKTTWRDAADKKYDIKKSEFVTATFLNTIGDSIIGSGGLQELYVNNPEEFAEFDRKMRKAKDFGVEDSFTHTLILPGKVYSTNSEKVNNTEMEWKLEPMYFALKDYEMKASSRAANPWIMVLSGLLAVGLIWVLFSSRRNSR
jgi:hypothetical protein